jgi:hypothetical protein
MTDACTFEFKLCDDAAAACAPGTISHHPGIAVTDGVFTVADVDFGAGAFTGDARWMEVYVQCTGDGGLVALSPRVELTPAPYSIRAGEGVGGPNALNVTPDGDVGIGTNSPAAMLHVAGDVRVDGALQAGSISSETPLQIQTDGTTRIFVDDLTGAVGIGTSGPFEPGPDTFGFRETFLPSARYGLSCAADPSSKEIFCFGGVLVLGNEQQMTDQIIRFDPDSDNVTVMTSVLPTARSGTSCAWSDATQRVYCFGGYDWEAGYTYLDQIVSFDPASGSLTNQSAVLPTERAYPSCAVDAGTSKIYCFGRLTHDWCKISGTMKQNRQLLQRRSDTWPTRILEHRDQLAPSPAGTLRIRGFQAARGAEDRTNHASVSASVGFIIRVKIRSISMTLLNMIQHSMQ